MKLSALEREHTRWPSLIYLVERSIGRRDELSEGLRRERDFARASLGDDKQKVAPDLHSRRGIGKKATGHVHSTRCPTRQRANGPQFALLNQRSVNRSTDLVNSPAAPETLARGARRSSLGARPFSLPLEP